MFENTLDFCVKTEVYFLQIIFFRQCNAYLSTNIMCSYILVFTSYPAYTGCGAKF